MAIESEIGSPSGPMGMGYFLIHVLGKRHGVKASDATALGNSVDEVEQRIARRGQHVFSQEAEMSANDIVARYVGGWYGDESQNDAFVAAVHGANVVWAPDGDEAFDDGSHVLQFDRGVSARLIGFRHADNIEETIASVVEVIMPADAFYTVLADWHQAFTHELRQWRYLN
ncbi:MAG: hypothetical protein ABIO40_07260 [Devosia sp.]